MKALGPVLSASRLARLSIALTLLLTGLSVGALRAAAQDDQRDPREMAITDEEAGKRTIILADEDGTDDFGRWTHRRWMRDRESSDVHIGPVLIDNKVWVAPDYDTAKKLFRLQADKNKEFPERDLLQDSAKGPFAFVIKEGPTLREFTEEAEALSACVDCDLKTEILTHRRIVLRKGLFVTTMYIFGRANIATPELASWYARQIALRM